jgi:hypothetical protein
MTTEIITNRKPRDVLSWLDLTDAEREAFSYIDPAKVENGETWPEFFRYKGHTYDLHDLESTCQNGIPAAFRVWHGYVSDSFWTGILVRYTDDTYTRVEVAKYITRSEHENA